MHASPSLWRLPPDRDCCRAIAASRTRARETFTSIQRRAGNRLPQSHPRYPWHTYRFQVYLPEDWRRDDHRQWPIILFLHGRGERGSEGMWQTQIGLPAGRSRSSRALAVHHRDAAVSADALLDRPRHARPWPWPPSIRRPPSSTPTPRAPISPGSPWAAMAHGNWRARIPNRWAAIAIAAGGIFWSYAPDRWQGLSPPRRICAGRGPHRHLALSRQRR